MDTEPIYEDKLTVDDVERIHKFGECWIKDYSRFNRAAWERALWLFAWERKVVWNDLRHAVPFGLPNKADMTSR